MKRDKKDRHSRLLTTLRFGHELEFSKFVVFSSHAWFFSKKVQDHQKMVVSYKMDVKPPESKNNDLYYEMEPSVTHPIKDWFKVLFVVVALTKIAKM